MFQNIINRLKKIYYYYFVVRDCGQNNDVNILKRRYRGKLEVTILGNNNKVNIDSTCVLNNVSLIIWGDNNIFTMDKDAKIQVGKISMYNGSILNIRHNATFQGVSIELEQNNCIIGADCMFSDGIKIRNYDGHKIIDILSGNIKNSPKDIIIGEHVWVGQDVSILGGTKILDGSIIGCKALVKGTIGPNCVAVGVPAQRIKENISWIRH